MVANVMWIVSLARVKRAGTTAEKGVRSGVTTGLSALGGQSVSWRVVTEKISAMGNLFVWTFRMNLLGESECQQMWHSD